MKQRKAIDSQTVKDNVKLSHGKPSHRQISTVKEVGVLGASVELKKKCHICLKGNLLC